MTPLWEASPAFLGPADIDVLEEQAIVIAEDHALKSRLIDAYVHSREPFPEPSHIEENLHGIFLSREDEARAIQFHKTPWLNRFEIVQTMEDERLREFGTRLIFFEARSRLPKEVVDRLDRETAERLISPDGKPMSLIRCLVEIDELEAANFACQQTVELLNDFREYLVNRSSKVSSYLETIS